MNYLTKVSERQFKSTRRGTNQHATKNAGLRNKTKLSVWLLCNVILVTLIGIQYYRVSIVEAANGARPLFVSPKAVGFYNEPTPSPEPEGNVEIRGYIKEVFGKDSDKAFKLLSCENSRLRPDAVNTAGNFPEGSRDIGVFQISEYWQDVNPKFLFNWKTNIAIAHQIFTDSGNSFKMWSCGKKLGI